MNDSSKKPAVYDASLVHTDLSSELERLKSQVELSWEKELLKLKYLGIEGASSILEIGSGSGEVTKKLLNHLPHASIICVEIDPVIIDYAKKNIGLDAAGRVNWIESSVVDSGLPSSSVDFAIARLVYQHLPDPFLVTKEVFRILKPGGKFAVIDEDNDLFWIIDPPLTEIPPLMKKIQAFHKSSGGNPFVGRQLCRILSNAGFKELSLDAVLFDSDDTGLEGFVNQMNPERLIPMVSAGIITEQEFDGLRSTLSTFFDSPRAHVLMQWFIAGGSKPIETDS